MKTLIFWGIITVIFSALIALFIASCYLVYKQFTRVCVDKTSKVISVGGCDRTGECGIMLENGLIGRRAYPVVGQGVSYKECE